MYTYKHIYIAVGGGLDRSCSGRPRIVSDVCVCACVCGVWCVVCGVWCVVCVCVYMSRLCTRLVDPIIRLPIILEILERSVTEEGLQPGGIIINCSWVFRRIGYCNI